MSKSADSSWERWGNAAAAWVPYITLALATVLSLIQPGQTDIARIETVALASLAAAWVFFMYTRAPMPHRAHPTRMGIYFVGLVALGSVLMTRQSIFFVFMTTGFFHAAELRPWPLAILGVAATSILINTLITGFPWPTIEGWSIYVSIIVIQILAIGFGTVMGERLAELSEQRKQAVSKLEAALEENAGLHAQLLTQAREAGVLDERHRMAREIHDTLAQGLTGIITQLEAAEQAKGHPPELERHLENAARLARASLSEARRSVEAWRPEPLESACLPDALAQVAEEWSAINSVPATVKTTGEPVPLNAEVEAALLRTAQEALTNVAKHAHASRAGLTLSYMGDVVMLDIRDDGIGFVTANGRGSSGQGFGLTAMRQRVSRVAGTLVVESEPGGGTAISARVPAIRRQQEIMAT
jgi:signal transduction histidine kinase